MTKPKILLVDDDRDFCRTLSEILDAAGYEIGLAHDGIAAVSVAQQINPDLIVLDIKMPAGDGLSVYHRLKLSANTRDIPLVFVSGYYQGEIRGEIFIRKPFDPDELIRHLREMLSQTQAGTKGKPARRS